MLASYRFVSPSPIYNELAMDLPDRIDIEMVDMAIGNVWMRLLYNDIIDGL